MFLRGFLHSIITAVALGLLHNHFRESAIIVPNTILMPFPGTILVCASCSYSLSMLRTYKHLFTTLAT